MGWIGWAGGEAIGRLALLTGSTAVLSRMLEPRDFGIAALVLTVVAVLAVFVGSPFEEALAQRRVLRRAHLESALAVSWLVGLGLFALSFGGGLLLARLYDQPEMGLLLPVATLSVFFSGHADITTALARRRRRFNDVAAASLIGHAVGISLALALAFAGAGVWALIAQRLLVPVARAIVLQWRIGVLLLPRWTAGHFADIARFAGFTFLLRLSDNLTYFVFNNVVGAVYGVTVLGYVNMAMRLVEPIRGAVVATGHNLAFSFFAKAHGDLERLRRTVEPVVARSALVVAPVFVGMAAVTSVLLPLVAGPGWDDAVGIAVCLALGAAIAVPANLVYTALSSSARPEFSLFSSIAGFSVTLVILMAAGRLGPISVGIARLAGDMVQAMVAIGLPARHLAWRRTDRFHALLPAWVLAAAMGIAVAGGLHALAGHGRPALLAAGIIGGILLYVALLGTFARAGLVDLLALARSGRDVGNSSGSDEAT